MNKTFTTDEIIRHAGYTDAYKEMSRKEFGAVIWIDFEEHKRIVEELTDECMTHTDKCEKAAEERVLRRVKEAIAKITKNPYVSRRGFQQLEKELFGENK